MAKDARQDRADGIAIGCFVAGLAWWYLGGGSAIHNLMDAERPMLAIAAVGLVVAVIAAVRLRHMGLKRALGSGGVVGIGLALLLASAVPWFNQHLDGSKGRKVGFVVRSIKRPSRSPPTLLVELDGEPAVLPFHSGCAEGASGAVTIHEGAFGMPWAGRITCGAQSER